MSKLVETLNKHKFIIIGALVILVTIIVVVVVTSKKDDTNTTTSATNNQSASTPRAPRTYEIELKSGANLSLTIKKGDTINWKLPFPHNLSGDISSPMRTTPGVTTFSKTFNEDFPGSTKIYSYRSGFQSSLSGTITVQK